MSTPAPLSRSALFVIATAVATPLSVYQLHKDPAKFVRGLRKAPRNAVIMTAITAGIELLNDQYVKDETYRAKLKESAVDWPVYGASLGVSTLVSAGLSKAIIGDRRKVSTSRAIAYNGTRTALGIAQFLGAEVLRKRRKAAAAEDAVVAEATNVLNLI